MYHMPPQTCSHYLVVLIFSILLVELLQMSNNILEILRILSLSPVFIILHRFWMLLSKSFVYMCAHIWGQALDVGFWLYYLETVSLTEPKIQLFLLDCLTGWPVNSQRSAGLCLHAEVTGVPSHDWPFMWELGIRNQFLILSEKLF